MSEILQIAGGIIIAGLMTAFILFIFWGVIFVLAAKVRDLYLHRTGASEMKQILTA